jgi:hypothetical protein
LFTEAEVQAAERRLILHDFPLQEHLDRAARNASSAGAVLPHLLPRVEHHVLEIDEEALLLKN